MGRLIYSMITSLDGTYLYGRRMYETMSYWETAHLEPDQPQVGIDYARVWQAADKLVFSTTLGAPVSQRTTIMRDFDPDAVRRLKEESNPDLTIDGPTLAAHALRAGLIDAIEPIVWPVVVGGGKRFLPQGVRADLRLEDSRSFLSGVVFSRYSVRR